MLSSYRSQRGNHGVRLSLGEGGRATHRGDICLQLVDDLTEGASETLRMQKVRSDTGVQDHYA